MSSITSGNSVIRSKKEIENNGSWYAREIDKQQQKLNNSLYVQRRKEKVYIENDLLSLKLSVYVPFLYPRELTKS